MNAVCIPQQNGAQAFALGYVGNRNLIALLQCLDEELWEMQFDKQKSESGCSTV